MNRTLQDLKHLLSQYFVDYDSTVPAQLEKFSKISTFFGAAPLKGNKINIFGVSLTYLSDLHKSYSSHFPILRPLSATPCPRNV